MLFYTLAITLSTFLAFISQKIETTRTTAKRKPGAHSLVFFFSFLSLFIISAIRFDVGTDFNSYTTWFKLVAKGNETYFEPGFTFIMGVLAMLTTNPQWLFAISALLTIGMVFIAIKKYSVNPALSVFLFSSMSFYFASFNGIRQFIAVAIILLASNLIIKRKMLLYISLVFLASLFHQSALIMIPAYFLFALKPRAITMLAITAIAGLTVFFREQFLQWAITIYPMYAENDDYLRSGFSFSEIMIATGVIVTLAMLHMFRRGILDRASMMHRVFFNTAFFSLILHTLLAWIPAVNRLTLYIDIVFIIIIPFLISKIQNTKWRITTIIAVMIIYGAYIYISIGVNNSHDVLPYMTIFSGNSQ